MNRKKRASSFQGFLKTLLVFLGAAVLTLVFFLVLPFIQVIGSPPENEMLMAEMDITNLPPPPPPPEQEPEEEEEPEEEPPQLEEEMQPLDLSQLELALNPGFGDGWLAGDFAVKLNAVASGKEMEALFSVSDLDQTPRAIYQAQPNITPAMRKKTPATVKIRFTVDKEGRVDKMKVVGSTDPLFDKSAMDALKHWKFEPGRRNGKLVPYSMELPMTFPKGR